MSVDTKAIDALFASWDHADSPGCAVGIVRDGELVYTRGYGSANLEYSIPIRPQSVFHVASVSKQFAARAISMLAEAGQCDLDANVRAIIPEVPLFGPTITLRHLIHHTSGLRDQWVLLMLAGWRDDDVKSNADVLDLVSRQRALNFAPGTAYTYCNTGYTLLGIAVERLTGQTLRAYCHEHFFVPLGMSRTHFHDDHTEIVPDRAMAYVPRDTSYRISIPAFDTVGATSLFTTVEDLARWMAYYETSLREADPLFTQLMTPAMLNNGTPLAYASGLTVGTYRGQRTIAHSGGDAGYRAHFLWLPDAHVGAIVLCNLSTMRPAELTQRILDIAVENMLAPVPPAPSPVMVPTATLTRYVGLYHNAATDLLRHVKMMGETLAIGLEGEWHVTALTADRFLIAGGPVITFIPHEKGFLLRERDGDGTSLDFLPVVAATPDGAILQNYTGDYYSEELDVTYTAALSESTLVLQRRKYPSQSLRPADADGFVTREFRITFIRDAEKSVTGFTLSTRRLTRLVFTRVLGEGSPGDPVTNR